MNAFKHKLSICTLIFACSCIIFSCGSDSNPVVSTSKKAQPPATKKKAQVVELLVKSGQGGAAKPKQLYPKTFEVAPPGKAGERALTAEEVEAAIKAFNKLDPKTFEVAPPTKPGERGLTQAEVDAMMSAYEKLDPNTFEVAPPSKPGERGMTQAELNEIMKRNEKYLGDVPEFPPMTEHK